MCICVKRQKPFIEVNFPCMKISKTYLDLIFLGNNDDILLKTGTLLCPSCIKDVSNYISRFITTKKWLKSNFYIKMKIIDIFYAWTKYTEKTFIYLCSKFSQLMSHLASGKLFSLKTHLIEMLLCYACMGVCMQFKVLYEQKQTLSLEFFNRKKLLFYCFHSRFMNI